jgi:hypothetical protein
MRGALPWLIRWAFRAGTRDFFSAMAAPVGTVQMSFSSPYTISIFCPHSLQARQAAVLGPLSLSMCL